MTGIGRLTVQWGITLVLATTLSFASLGFTIFTSPLKQRESHLLVLCDTPAHRVCSAQDGTPLGIALVTSPLVEFSGARIVVLNTSAKCVGRSQ